MRPNPEIDALLVQLLDSGVSRKYISRLAAELDDHAADLESEAVRFGVSPPTAASDALLRLGAPAAIASEFERRPELRSRGPSRDWLELLLHAIASFGLILTLPVRAVASGQPTVLRYTAATAGGTSVTFAILGLLTAIMAPDGGWGAKVIESASATLARQEVDGAAVPAPENELRSGGVSGAPSPSAHDGSHDDSSSASPAPAAPGARAADSPSLPSRPRRTPPISIPASAGIAPDVELSVEPGEPLLPRRLSGRSGRALPRVLAAEIFPSISLGLGDREFQRIAQVQPDYPRGAIRRGIEGYVLVEYTITRTGAVREAVIVESSSTLFDRAALDAVNGLQYRPRLLWGKPVDVHGVRTLIRFELEA